MRRSRKIPERLNDGRNNLRKPTQNWFHHPSRDAELPSARLRRIDGSRLSQLLGLSGSCLVSFIEESLTGKPQLRSGQSRACDEWWCDTVAPLQLITPNLPDATTENVTVIE